MRQTHRHTDTQTATQAHTDRERYLRYSKERPPFATRAIFAPGPNWTLAPLPANSSPIAVPHSPNSAGSHECATVSPDGNWVVDPGGQTSPLQRNPSLSAQ